MGIAEEAFGQSCYQGHSLRDQGQDLYEVSSRILEAKARPREQRDCFQGHGIKGQGHVHNYVNAIMAVEYNSTV